MTGVLDRYQLLHKIGQGSFGTVWKGLDTLEGRDVAVKVIDLEDLEEDIGDLQEEINTLRGCRHPHITQYYASAVVPGSSRLLIVMELMSLSVADLLVTPPTASPEASPPDPAAPAAVAGLPEPVIAHVLRGVLKALAYLHSQARMHRDIKAANILLSSAGAVKVSDFGVSAQLSGTVGYKRRTFVGSPLWMAPEVIEQAPERHSGVPGGPDDARDGYNMSADIWSLGISAIEMARGEPPRGEVSSFRLLFMIVRDEPPSLEGPFSTEFKDFVWQCLRKDPTQRPSPADLLHHPFVAGADACPELPHLVATHAARQALRFAAAAGPGSAGASPRDAEASDGKAAGQNGWDFAAGMVASAGAAAALATSSLPLERAPVRRTLASDPGIIGATEGTTGVGPGPHLNPVLDAAAATTAADNAATVRSAPPGATPSAGDKAAPGPSVAPLALLSRQGNGAGAGPLPATSRFVPVSGVDATPAQRPGTTSAAPSPDGRRPRPAPGGGPVAALLRPALSSAAAAAGNEPARGAAAAAVAALSQLETLAPGSTSAALGDMLASLSASDDPELAALRGAAAAVFGGGAERGAGPGPDVPAGPLGGFLLARWRESVARERLQHHQQQYAQN
ncbi:hypothetical protein ACKKBF_B04480 [Auxenochlorella protothecoides x Auxenochlorella symbiontica]